MKSLTDFFILSVASVVILYDVFAAIFLHDTISEKMARWAGTDNIWVIPMFWACLFGHFFLNAEKELPYMELRTLAVVCIFAGCVVLNLTLLKHVPVWASGIAGLALGAGLWVQK